MQPNGLHTSVLPFSYLRADSPAGFTDGFSRTPNPPLTGFLRATEYRQPTVRYTPSMGEEDVLRSIQKELDLRMSRVGTNAVQTMEEGTGGSGKESRKRTREKVKKEPEGGKRERTQNKMNRFGKQEIETHGKRNMVDDNPKQIHGNANNLSASSQGQSRIFHTETSGSVRKRFSDLDSGCQSDSSEQQHFHFSDDTVGLVKPVAPFQPSGLFDNFVLRTKFTAEPTHTGSGFLQVPVPQNRESTSDHYLSPLPIAYLEPSNSHRVQISKSHHHHNNHARNADHQDSRHGDNHHRNHPKTSAPQSIQTPTRLNKGGFEISSRKFDVKTKPRVYLPSPVAISSSSGRERTQTNDFSKPVDQSNTASCCSFSSRTLLVIFLLVLMVLIGFGAGFAAGWFGRERTLS